MAGKALIPKLDWLADYSASALVKDVIAGLILSILLVPQAMAYAQLAGLPPETGLFAALLPPLLYGIFGSSRFVSMGPVALVSLVVAEAAGGAGGDPQIAAVIIAIEAGLFLLIIGGLNLGRLVNFISEPVLLGFTAAAAFLIAASQLPTLLGIDAARSGNLPSALQGLFGNISALDPTTAFIGAGALVVLLLVNRFAAPLLWKIGVHPPYRQALAKSLPLLVIITAALVAAGSSQPVTTVEPVSAGFPTPPWPLGGLQLWLDLIPSALTVAVIVFVTAIAVGKSLAGNDRRHLDSSREAVGLGAGNIVAALTGGYAVGASLSRSALVEDSGARSPIATLIASLVVLAVLLFLAPLLVYLPKTALAALVISAVFGLIKLREIKQVWKHDRIEGWIIALSFIATLALGVRLGLAIGAGLGLAHFLWFSSLPRVTRIGSDDGGHTFRSVTRDQVEIETLPALVIRIDRSIYFGNCAFVEDGIIQRLAQYEGVECLVLDMRSVNDVDASGAAMLLRLVSHLKEEHIATRFAETHEPVARRIKPYGGRISTFHRTVAEALEACGVVQTGAIAPT